MLRLLDRLRGLVQFSNNLFSKYIFLYKVGETVVKNNSLWIAGCTTVICFLVCHVVQPTVNNRSWCNGMQMNKWKKKHFYFIQDILAREKTQDNDETYYLWAMRFFMEFCRHHSKQVDLVRWLNLYFYFSIINN